MFEGQKDKLSLWKRATFVDPKFTKTYKGKGGFRGRSTTATHIIQRATEEFGPVGIGWGWDIADSYYIDGAPMVGDDGTNYGNEKLHVLRLSVWYVEDGVRSSSVTHFGQTTFVGMQKKAIWSGDRKIGEKEAPVSDEEHAKKSLTDALTKALSCIGFASDIHLGMWEDNKYVKQMEQEAEDRAALPRNGNGQHTVASAADDQQDRSARQKGVDTESEVAKIKADILAQRTHPEIVTALKRGYAMADRYSDPSLHDWFKDVAAKHWASIKQHQETAQ